MALCRIASTSPHRNLTMTTQCHHPFNRLYHGTATTRNSTSQPFTWQRASLIVSGTMCTRSRHCPQCTPMAQLQHSAADYIAKPKFSTGAQCTAQLHQPNDAGIKRASTQNANGYTERYTSPAIGEHVKHTLLQCLRKTHGVKAAAWSDAIIVGQSISARLL